MAVENKMMTTLYLNWPRKDDLLLLDCDITIKNDEQVKLKRLNASIEKSLTKKAILAKIVHTMA